MDTNNQEESLDLSFYFESLLKHWRLIAIIAFLGILGAVIVNILMQPRYKASVLMMIDRENSGRIDQTSFGSWTSDEDYYRTQYQLLETRTLLEKVYKDLNLIEVPEFSTNWKSLKNALKVEPVTRSRLVNLTISSYDPKLAAKIANYLSKSFTEQNVKNRLSMASEVLTALETTEQSPEQKELLNSLPQIINSDFIKGLKREEMETSSQLSLLLGKYTNNHPEVIAVRKKLEAIQKTIERETKRLLQSIKIDLSGQFSANNIRIIDEASVPLKPYRPRKLLNIAIGLFAGCILGILISFLIDFLDQTTKTAKDIEDKFKIPLLGFVPHEKQKKGFEDYRIMLKEGNVLTAENIRNIRTMLSFSLNAGQIKTLLITSSLQGEGKSFFSSSLATAFAQIGKKVLLIDGDLRRGRLHRIFRLSNEKGLSSLWASENVLDKFENNIQKTDVKGLSVLTSGPRPANSSELLSTPLLKELIEKLTKSFDLIIVDCPASLPVADTFIWGQIIPRAVFTARQGKTPIKSAMFTLERLKQANVKVIGGILNDCYKSGTTYGEYGYYRKYYSEDKN
ncbi:MAG: polysaccharide biosynthesis tyrosine autokinase [Elusimicrobiaceae bacterium]|nr:polysaccharide biosynthesis tyrosine autokinase [Elusimicrobiaceae bacterium]